MSKKLEVIHNYLIITDTVDSSTVEFPTNRVRYKDTGNTINIVSVDDNSQNKSYQVAELVDSEGVAFADKEEILLFLREKQNWLKFVAPRLSSLFVEQTKQEVKQDTTLNIKWESEPDLIDVSADTISDTSDSKDLFEINQFNTIEQLLEIFALSEDVCPVPKLV